MVTVRELMDIYNEHALDYYRKPDTRRPTGEHIQVAHATKHLLNITLPQRLQPATGCRMLEDMSADLMRAEHLELARKAMVATGRLARKTINARIARIKRMFHWAGEPAQRLIPSSVSADLAMLRALKIGRTAAPDYESIEPVAWEAVVATMSATTLEVSTMIEVAWLTGMRPCELCAMRRSLIQMPRSGPWTYTVPPDANKNAHHNQPRIVYIGPEAQAVLKPWLQRIGSRDALWTRDRYRLWRAIKQANRRLKAPNWHPNQLRHSCGVRVTEDKSLRAAQVVLGHARISTTQIYAKYQKGEQALAAQVMAELG